MSSPVRNAAHEAEAALRRAGEIRHALAVRKLLASHAALTAQVKLNQTELLAARRLTERAEYRDRAAHV